MALPDEPHTRLETYLAKLAGQNVTIPDTPISRIECYLEYLCENGGGGGGGGFTPSPSAGGHNGIFRGQSLGSSLTADQSAAIQAGNFDGMYVGDYWTINGTVYRIAGFDIFLHAGDTELTKHHAVIVPDGVMNRSPMNEEAVTTGGYVNSLMKTSGLDATLATIKADFGADHIVSRRARSCSAVSNGAPSNWAWYTTEMDLMTEGQVFGRGAWATQQQVGFNVGTNYSRFPLFSIAPEFITCRSLYWLQDVRNNTSYASIGADGTAGELNAAGNGGIRPHFLVA